MLDGVSRSQQLSSGKGQHRNVLIAVRRDDCDQDCSSLYAPAGSAAGRQVNETISSRYSVVVAINSRFPETGTGNNSARIGVCSRQRVRPAQLIPSRRVLYCLSSSRHVVPVVAVIQPSVGEWLSLVEHLVRDQGVGGSNPLSPTNLFKIN